MSVPTLQQAYDTPGNPTDLEPAERSAAQSQSKSDAPATEHRTAATQNPDPSTATASSLGHGIRGAPPGEEAHGATQAGLDATPDAEQMAAPGEGRVAEVVDAKPGAGGAQPGLESDLDRKKAEQADKRAAVQAGNAGGDDSGAARAQEGGPAVVEGR